MSALIPEVNQQSDKHLVQWYDKNGAALDAFVLKVKVQYTGLAIQSLLKDLNDKDRGDVLGNVEKNRK